MKKLFLISLSVFMLLSSAVFAQDEISESAKVYSEISGLYQQQTTNMIAQIRSLDDTIKLTKEIIAVPLTSYVDFQTEAQKIKDNDEELLKLFSKLRKLYTENAQLYFNLTKKSILKTLEAI